MTSRPLTPTLGRIILAQLEEPKPESAIVLDGFKPWHVWDSQRLTRFLARDPAPEGVRTPGPWRAPALGLESETRGDFFGR